MRILFFYSCLVACAIYAIMRGGKPERIGVLVYVLGLLATKALRSPIAQRYYSVDLGVLWVDAVVLLAYLALALKSDRYWPLWTAALQLIVVLAHVAKLLDPDMVRFGYAFVIRVWNYPMLLTIALGTRSHHKKQVRNEQRRSEEPIRSSAGRS